MKTYIIKLIANNFRKKLPIARNLKVQNISYMYEYNYFELFKTLIDSFKLEPQHFNNMFIK